MDAQTSLVIAVCVLGTLVGVAVVILLALLIFLCCPNGRFRARSWVARRNRRTRADIELEQLAAATGNFISDSMLPGNRTGASENLGIRSPDPRRVPALRVPQDLSPSPPFVPGQGQPIRQNQPRCRQPSPKRGHFLTVLNTLMPHGSPPQPGHMDSHDQNDLSDTNFSSKDYRRRTSDRGEYARIPSNSPKSRINCSVRQKTQNPRGNVKGMEGYPDSDHTSEEDEEVENCRDFGHSYYKPGGYTSYFPQNVFREKPTRRNRSPRRESRSLYSRVPVNDNSLESPNRSKKLVGSKSQRRAPHAPGSSQTVGHEGSRCREGSRYLNRSQDEQLASTDTTSHHASARGGQGRRDRSPPLASSSRNTSQDRSTSLSARQDNSQDERKRRSRKSSNEQDGRGGVLPRRSRRVASRHRNVNTGREASKVVLYSGQAGVAAIQKPPRTSANLTRQSTSPRSSRDSLPQVTAGGSGAAAPIDYLQTTNGQFVPVSSLLCSGSSIQVSSRGTPVGDGVSFRENNTASTDPRPTNVHANRDAAVMGTMSGRSSSAGMTLPSLTSAHIINNNNVEPSVLYHNSHHSSTQSLRPPSHLFGGSSTFAGSHTIHLNMMQTPVAHSSHVVSLSDVEPNSPKATIRFRPQGYRPKQPWRAKEAPGSDKSPEKNGTQGATLSDTDDVGEDRQDDLQAPDSVPPSPPASHTSSSSSPGTAVSLAIRQCVPVSKEVVSCPPTERPSFLDSRDLGDPTTASLSWDHLTPDPSPVFSGETDFSTSFYAPHYKRKKRPLPGDRQTDFTLPSATTLVGVDLDDTFARNYELKPYRKLELRNDIRVAANLNPAIEKEVVASETVGDTNDQMLTIKKGDPDAGSQCSIPTDASVSCTSLAQTQCRQNIVVRPSNILNRFALKEKVPRDSVTSVKSDESFSAPLLPSKSFPHPNGGCSNIHKDYSEHLKKKICPQGSEASSPDDLVMYSELRQSLSLQSNGKPKI